MEQWNPGDPGGDSGGNPGGNPGGDPGGAPGGKPGGDQARGTRGGTPGWGQGRTPWALFRTTRRRRRARRGRKRMLGKHQTEEITTRIGNKAFIPWSIRPLCVTPGVPTRRDHVARGHRRESGPLRLDEETKKRTFIAFRGDRMTESKRKSPATLRHPG